MKEFIASLPKAELHVHLEGCVEAATLWELAQQQHSALAYRGREAVEQLYATSDFASFLQAFKQVCLHLRSARDYDLITYRALRNLAKNNIRYAEVTISAGVILWKEEDIENSFQGIEAGYRRAREETGIRVQWIFDAVRQLGPEAAFAVVKTAAEYRTRGVVAFGIGGDERQGPAEMFREVFARARERGLRVTAHAGETAGPESVRAAVEELGAERIGHGISAARDPRLVRELAERGVPLEICLSSNVRTGCFAHVAESPLRDYFDQGVRVCLGADDPSLFGTDLNQEYALAQQAFGFTGEELVRLAKASFQSAFLSEEEKAAHLSLFADVSIPGESDETTRNSFGQRP